MYVIMDLEWFETRNRHVCPTQVAALRIDDEWRVVSVFYELISPHTGVAVQWNHVAFSGASTEDFVRAYSAYTIFDRLEKWLQEDDVLCWWVEEPANIFNMLTKSILKHSFAHKRCILQPYYKAYSSDSISTKGSPYLLAKRRGICTQKPEHCSINDVNVIQHLMKNLHISTNVLREPVPTPVVTRLIRKASAQFPYWYDETTNIVHSNSDCMEAKGAALKGVGTIKTCIVRQYKPCPTCCRETWKRSLREYNSENIRQRRCGYFFFDNSPVFHRATCYTVLQATRPFDAAVYYDTCISSGRTPCKVCNPVPGLYSTNGNVSSCHKAANTSPQWMGKNERRALERHSQAVKERASIDMEKLTASERQDALILTSTNYSFWAGKGYGNFHLRTCRKLQGIKNIRGFESYQQAIRAGYLPCRECKPNAKHNLQISMPFDTEVRKNETVETVLAYCTRMGLEHTYKEPIINIHTDLADWKINVTKNPVVIEHRPLSCNAYHQQHRMFLSMTDAIWYIRKHDNHQKPSLEQMLVESNRK